jgi:5-methylcytosine-specific restriction endonuclease McrA
LDAILFASIVTLVVSLVFHALKSRIKSQTVEETRSENQRGSPEYRAWRIAVLKRDGFRCVWCKSEKNLEAHHIYSFASFPELRFEVKNGLTLCRDCHLLTPNHGSKEKSFSQRIINAK